MQFDHLACSRFICCCLRYGILSSASLVPFSTGLFVISVSLFLCIFLCNFTRVCIVFICIDNFLRFQSPVWHTLYRLNCNWATSTFMNENDACASEWKCVLARVINVACNFSFFFLPNLCWHSQCLCSSAVIFPPEMMVNMIRWKKIFQK